MISNQITKAVFELLGDKVAGGYTLYVHNTPIPLYLNKDEKTEYPQIRVSPFIEKGDNRYQKHIDSDKRAYRHWQYGVFQVDIYAKKLSLAQDIHDVIKKRLVDFFNLETVLFSYNHEFERIDENTYRNMSYALLDDDFFKDIYGIVIDETIIDRVFTFDDLKMNSFFVNDKYLYVKTNQNIKHIQIKALMQGRLFSNGFSCSDNGIHDYALTKQRNLSSLTRNEVERISFDLEILYSKKLNRETLPRVNKIAYPKPNVR